MRLIEALRNSSFKIEGNKEEYVHYVKLACPESLLEEMLREIEEDKFESLFHLKDKIEARKSEIKAKEFREKNENKGDKKKKKQEKEKEKEEEKREE